MNTLFKIAYLNHMKFTFSDLFAGIGGMRIAFESFEANAFLL